MNVWEKGGKTPIWGLDALAIRSLRDCVWGAPSSDSHPALNPQPKSAVRDQHSDHTPRLEKYVIFFARSVECATASGDARHSRSQAEDGEELPGLQFH